MCKFNKDDICVNADCPYVADYCPVFEDDTICIHNPINGSLVNIPCKEGTTIYHLYKAGNIITEDKVFAYHFEICTKPCVSFENYFWYGTNKRVDTILVEHYGKYWFTDKAEAKKKLEELKGEKQ